ncbi:MAG: discoidin domain-containing protein [Anaerolineales bacterium]
MRREFSWILLFAALAGCVAIPAAQAPPTGRSPWTATRPHLPTATFDLRNAPSGGGTSAPTEVPAPDLSARPLYWFAPLPPMPTGPGREYTGSDDFMDLFSPDAPWTATASNIQVFKLYGEWVAYHATDDELRRAVAGIRERGLALAVEAGPLDPQGPAECGQGIESFAGTDEGLLIAQRLRDAGGRLDVIALDEPRFFAGAYDGPNACHWDAERIAAEVGQYIAVMRLEFPNVVIGDTEPLTEAAGVNVYTEWLRTFREVNGFDLAFLHMDIDWSRPTWPAEVRSIENFGEVFGVPVGIIYNGNHQDTTDESWLSIAGERVKRYEDEAGGSPAHVLFQSWNDKPDRALPESEPYTFTGFIRTYFEDRSALGFRTEGAGANVAFGKQARVSATYASMGGALAVDGDPGTVWNSGGGPLQWIQIDLGTNYNLSEIRLVVNQSPEGRTVHVLYGRGSGTVNEQRTLHVFDGVTQDSDVLVYKPAETMLGIRYLWIDSTESPSWISWREIEAIQAGQ